MNKKHDDIYEQLMQKADVNSLKKFILYRTDNKVLSKVLTST